METHHEGGTPLTEVWRQCDKDRKASVPALTEVELAAKAKGQSWWWLGADYKSLCVCRAVRGGRGPGYKEPCIFLKHGFGGCAWLV